MKLSIWHPTESVVPPVEETPTKETIGQDAEPTIQSQILDETSTGTYAMATGFAIGTVCICALLYSLKRGVFDFMQCRWRWRLPWIWECHWFLQVSRAADDASAAWSRTHLMAQQQCAMVGKDHIFVVVMYSLAFCFKFIQMHFQLNKNHFYNFNSQKRLRKNDSKTTLRMNYNSWNWKE